MATVLKTNHNKTMITDFPFSNFTVRLSNLRLPISIDTWTSFFKEDFSNVKVNPKGQADLQFSLCDAYRIDFDAPVIVVGFGKFSTMPFNATLFNSNSTFYLLLQMGTEHHFASAASTDLKIASRLFNQHGGGRFSSISNDILISFEEDEFSKYYLLATSKKSLMEMDELFNFSREILLSDSKSLF